MKFVEEIYLKLINNLLNVWSYITESAVMNWYKTWLLGMCHNLFPDYILALWYNLIGLLRIHDEGIKWGSQQLSAYSSSSHLRHVTYSSYFSRYFIYLALYLLPKSVPASDSHKEKGLGWGRVGGWNSSMPSLCGCLPSTVYSIHQCIQYMYFHFWKVKVVRLSVQNGLSHKEFLCLISKKSYIG